MTRNKRRCRNRLDLDDRFKYPGVEERSAAMEQSGMCSHSKTNQKTRKRLKKKKVSKENSGGSEMQVVKHQGTVTVAVAVGVSGKRNKFQ